MSVVIFNLAMPQGARGRAREVYLQCVSADSRRVTVDARTLPALGSVIWGRWMPVADICARADRVRLHEGV